MARFLHELKKIAVYTSGGDSPGMNAAVRSVVRMANSCQIDVWGVIGGYSGFLEHHLRPLGPRDMANIIQRGGTILKTGRCPEVYKLDFRKRIAEYVKSECIDALVCIGGDGSFTAAHLLWEEFHIPTVGIPGTIDNDICGTEVTIGFDTAVNTALDAIDKIRDTASSHNRLFIVEVMGRNSGFIATHVGLAGGAEGVFIPEIPVPLDKIIEKIKSGHLRGKKSSILITAEGQKPGRAYHLAEQIRKKSGLEAKVCILGHVQRGGTPSAQDRNLASQLGHAALLCLLEKECDVMVGVHSSKLVRVPLVEAVKGRKNPDKALLELTYLLSL